MTAESLVRVAMSDRHAHSAITFAVRHMRRTIGRLSEQTANANAEWHDDPEAEDHEEYHAPADVQFPRDVRDQAIRELVAHYLAELSLEA